MKISELLREAISFTEHLKDVETVVDNSIKKAISSLSSDLFGEKIRNNVNRSKNYNSMKSTLEVELENSLTNSLEENLTQIARDILSTVENDYPDEIKVKFADLGDADYGQATNYFIELNTNYIYRLVDDLVPNLIESASELSTDYFDDDMFDDFFSFLKDKKFQTKIVTGSFIQRTIDDIASIFLHELVHVRQHIPQFQKGRDSTEYRSYLDKTKGEFYKTDPSPQDSPEVKKRYWNLYVSSPQEIAARAHQAAILIIKDTGLNTVQALHDLPKKNSVLAQVTRYARDQFKEPENPQETQVLNRYIKLIYQEVDRYYDRIKQKLDNA